MDYFGSPFIPSVWANSERSILSHLQRKEPRALKSGGLVLKDKSSKHKDVIIPPINDGSETTTSDVDKANAFNSFSLKASPATQQVRRAHVKWVV